MGIACKHSFKDYGIKFEDGKNVLSGPALTQAHTGAGPPPGMGVIQMGSESWERRLGKICRQLVFDEIGEGFLYEQFRDGKLTDELCRPAARACQTPAPRKAERKRKVNEEAKARV